MTTEKVKCARCGEEGSPVEMRSTLLPGLYCHERHCYPPAEDYKRLLKAAEKLTEDYWEGRYYAEVPEREKLMAKDLAEMLDKVLEVCDV